LKLFVGLTDSSWFEYLSSLEEIDEINFWQPSATQSFKAIKPGELFLFKLHSPRDFIVGGGIFTYFTILPISLAWQSFGKNNGADSFEKMRSRIAAYRRLKKGIFEDFQIGCILLTQPFFFEQSDWFPVPEWSPNIVRGKSYDLDKDAGKFIWNKVQNVLSKRRELNLPNFPIKEEKKRYGSPTLIIPRLGQGSFKIMVTDVYHRSCAVTKERILPVLEAAHIKPYSQSGPHQVNNGILFRSDFHKLFDAGYMTITQKLNIEISNRIKEEFENGEYYRTFHGKMMNLPSRVMDQPAKEFLSWHNEKIYKG
jgi:putative restriction endonuclease